MPQAGAGQPAASDSSHSRIAVTFRVSHSSGGATMWKPRPVGRRMSSGAASWPEQLALDQRAGHQGDALAQQRRLDRMQGMAEADAAPGLGLVAAGGAVPFGP